MSGSVPKTPARRAAISGDTGTRPFTIPDTCLRLTPRASAVCVIVTPSGPMYISLRISPGWAGLCIRPELSMVVFIIHLVRVPGVETEGHAVVLIHPNGITVAMQWMKPHSGHRHLCRLGRGIEGSKDQIQASRVLRLHLASTPCLEERCESLVPETLDHRDQCNLRGDELQPLWLRKTALSG